MNCPLNPMYPTLVVSSSPPLQLSSKKRVIEVVVFHNARFSGNSKTSDAGTGWGTSIVCVAARSDAVEKSKSARFLKSLRVFGAAGVGAVYISMEWSFTCPANLFNFRVSTGQPSYTYRISVRDFLVCVFTIVDNVIRHETWMRGTAGQNRRLSWASCRNRKGKENSSLTGCT